MALIARSKLAKFKKSGPILLYTMYIVTIVGSIVYAIAAQKILGESIMDGSTIGDLIFTVVCFIICIVYFTKRKDLFVK